MSIGTLNAWRLPDVPPASTNIAGEWGDMSFAFDAYFLMKERAALEEFGRRWYDTEGGGRQGMWKEIVEFWGFADVLPLPPDDTQIYWGGRFRSS